MSDIEPQRSSTDLQPTNSAPGPAAATSSAAGAKAAAVGLWVVVVAGLAWGVSQAVMTAGKLFG